MKVSKLQIIIIAVALTATLYAVLIFSGILPGFGTFTVREAKKVSVWGIIDERLLFEIFADIRKQPHNIEIIYSRKNPQNFEEELISALARQAGPDVALFPSELILEHRDKFRLLSPEIITERNFRDRFTDGTELLIFKEGILGMPLFIDSLVLYWNRDLFRNEAISLPPKTWDEFLLASQKLTKIDERGNVLKSGAALGVESNINNFKEIFSMLVLQAGSPLVEKNTFKVNFEAPGAQGINVVENALRFYTEFANPQKASYSWSRAMPFSGEAFSREILAMYLGFGSEFQAIRNLNPHLNFDIASVPQIRGGKLNLTYGRFWSAGITKQARDFEAALETASFLSNSERLKTISKNLNLAPAKRDFLAEGPADGPALETIFREAVKFRSWLDIDSQKTSAIFSEMIRSVYSGAKNEGQAARDAKIKLDALYNPQ